MTNAWSSSGRWGTIPRNGTHSRLSRRGVTERSATSYFRICLPHVAGTRSSIAGVGPITFAVESTTDDTGCRRRIATMKTLLASWALRGTAAVMRGSNGDRWLTCSEVTLTPLNFESSHTRKAVAGTDTFERQSDGIPTVERRQHGRKGHNKIRRDSLPHSTMQRSHRYGEKCRQKHECWIFG